MSLNNAFYNGNTVGPHGQVWGGYNYTSQDYLTTAYEGVVQNGGQLGIVFRPNKSFDPIVAMDSRTMKPIRHSQVSGGGPVACCCRHCPVCSHDKSRWNTCNYHRNAENCIACDQEKHGKIAPRDLEKREVKKTYNNVSVANSKKERDRSASPCTNIRTSRNNRPTYHVSQKRPTSPTIRLQARLSEAELDLANAESMTISSSVSEIHYIIQKITS
jgi:hypothetical protein